MDYNKQCSDDFIKINHEYWIGDDPKKLMGMIKAFKETYNIGLTTDFKCPAEIGETILILEEEVFFNGRVPYECLGSQEEDTVVEPM